MKFEITTSPVTKDITYLTQKINQEAKVYGKAFSFAIFLRNDLGVLIAGCNGSIIFGSIHTDQLWVDPGFRKKGIGTKLMERVHDFGKERSCRLATVSTMSFQAPDFYRKLGYQRDFCQEGYTKNAECIFMSKSLYE